MKNIDLETFTLGKGNHKSIDSGACIMELVSYIANEPWSDHPECACPILTEYAIRINDQFSDEHRQLLKPLIPMLLNTKSIDEVQIARKRLIRWRNITVTYPLILDLLKLNEIADKLRSFKNSIESMAEAKNFLESKKDEIIEAYKRLADAYTYAYADAEANAYTYAYAYATTYADADAEAEANADANADAYAYAYADAWRNKIAAVAIETLRMACEVKE